MNFQKICEEIDSGKVRGYSCEGTEGDRRIYKQFAIKKNSGYIGYFFSIPFDLMESIDDIDEYEKTEIFQDLQDAIKFIAKNGGDFEKFAPFKGVKPI